jgi:hypothetical protein
MGFHISTDSFPRIHSYASASRHEEDVEPIRGNGRNAGIKPIGKRSAAHMDMRRERNRTSPLGNVGQAIVFRLYETDCVTYFEDGSSTIDTAGWSTQSTVVFIDALVLGSFYNAPSCEGSYLYRLDSKEFLSGSKLHLDKGIPLNPEHCIVHRVNRRAMREVRKLYAPFLKYARSMIKVAYPPNVGVSDAEARGMLELAGRLNVTRDSFPSTRSSDVLCNIMRHDDIEDWADALQSVAAMSMGPKWGASASGGYERVWMYSPHRVMKHFDDIMKYEHCDAVLVAEQLPIGEYKKDPNRKYVS